MILYKKLTNFIFVYLPLKIVNSFKILQRRTFESTKKQQQENKC
jgi:hypothetical protein